MPTHKVHELIDKLVLGERYPDTHDWIDEPVKWLGARHRVQRHNATVPAVIFIRELMASGDAEKALKKGLSATLHLAADELHLK
jgi:hypothetical protein